MKPPYWLTPDRLRALARYDPDTGVFTAVPGSEDRFAVLTLYDGVQLRLTVHGTRRHLPADAVALYYATGEWPGPVVWHHDRDPFNLRLSNLSPLRDALKGPTPE